MAGNAESVNACSMHVSAISWQLPREITCHEEVAINKLFGYTDGYLMKSVRVRLRYSLRALLLLPLLIGWWIAWPTWTARAFTDAVVDRDEGTAQNVIAAGQAAAPAFGWIFKDTIVDDDEGFTCDLSGVEHEYSQRTPSDYLLGRQPVKVTVSWTGAAPNDPLGRRTTYISYYWFIARRGGVVPDSSKPQPVGR